MTDEERITNRIRRIRTSRSLMDKVIIWMFSKAFLRYADRHINSAKETGVINSHQLHMLDAQMKGDLGFPGFPQP